MEFRPDIRIYAILTELPEIKKKFDRVKFC